MSIKSNLESSKSKLDALLTYANGVTGKADVSIGDAIRTLAEGYGGGGGVPAGFGSDDPTYVYGYMLKAIMSGNWVAGQFTMSTYSNSTEALLIDTGLATLHGFLLVYHSYPDNAYQSSTQNSVFVIITINPDGTYNANSLAHSGLSILSGDGTANSANVQQTVNYAQGTIYQAMPVNGALRFDNGRIYYKARYNKNANYQIMKTGLVDWLAW